MERDEVVHKYYGTDKIAALKDAIIIIDMKMRRWEKRRSEYLEELQTLVDRTAPKEPLE